MARSSLLRQVVRGIGKANRESARQQRVAVREQARWVRESHRQQARDEREAKLLYAESRAEEADDMTAEAQQRLEELSGLLAQTLSVDDWIDLEKLKITAPIAAFSPGSLAVPLIRPAEADFLPAPPAGLGKFLPGATARFEKELAAGRERLDSALTRYSIEEAQRIEALSAARATHDRLVASQTEKLSAQNAEVDDLRNRLAQKDPDAVVEYMTMVLENSTYPDGFPSHAKLAYVPESAQLVIEFDFPPFDIVPTVESYKYVKSRDDFSEKAIAETRRRALYTGILAQVTLRTLHEVYESDRNQAIHTIVFNGHVSSVDRGTGRPVRPCVISLRCTREVFEGIDLRRVDPEACLQALNAAVSKKPTELAPVRPVLEFNMVDRRFIEEADVLSGLDQRPNLMELTPNEFESLITNLFERMGLETRQTIASRDGGVDCVAFDARPIFGGKVVIQAKRYKGTVGVSSVRDLYGTLQNEGASKGILVTTSGYGTASYEFANGKPIELLDGPNLLFLLSEHAGIEAKIEPPDGWRDPTGIGA